MKFREMLSTVRERLPKAIKEAGCEGLLFHDLRRSAVRNMMQAGVRQAVAMKISGRSTPRIFPRYNMIDESDLHEAVKKVEEHKG